MQNRSGIILSRNFFCEISASKIKNICIYFDKQQRSVKIRETRDVFMVKNLCRDERNHACSPTKTEHDLAVYKNEISKIPNGKLLFEQEIFLTAEEDDKFKLFFAIMSFRSKPTCLSFGKSMTDSAKKMYRHFQKDGNYANLWKRNLSLIVNCRSIGEVQRHPGIDEPFKTFLLRDTEYICGMHFTAVESAESEPFVLGDTYPVIINGTTDRELSMHLYSIFPLSPRRAMLLVSNGAEQTPQSVTRLRECVLLPPFRDPETGTIRMRVKKLYPEKARCLNDAVLHNARDGVVFSKRPPRLPN